MNRIIVINNSRLEEYLSLMQEDTPNLNLVVIRNSFENYRPLCVSEIENLDQLLKEGFIEEPIPQRANSKIYNPDRVSYQKRGEIHVPKSIKNMSQYCKTRKH